MASLATTLPVKESKTTTAGILEMLRSASFVETLPEVGKRQNPVPLQNADDDNDDWSEGVPRIPPVSSSSIEELRVSLPPRSRTKVVMTS